MEKAEKKIVNNSRDKAPIKKTRISSGELSPSGFLKTSSELNISLDSQKKTKKPQINKLSMTPIVKEIDKIGHKISDPIHNIAHFYKKERG